MSKCTAHLICEVHRKLTMTVALAFGFDRSFLWSTELQHNLVSIQPHMIERLRLRYFELCSSSASPTSDPFGSSDALPAECGRSQPQLNAPRPCAYKDDDEEADAYPISSSSTSSSAPLNPHLRLIVREAGDDVVSSHARVETFFVRWDDFTQRYCNKANKGRDECVLQAFRHGRRPHDAEFDRLFGLFAWLLHESRFLFGSEGSVSSITTALAQISLDLGSDSSDAAESQQERVAVHTELGRSLGIFFGDDSDVVRGFLDADFVFSSTDGQTLRWRSYLLAHLMRDITDAVLGLFGLRQKKSDDYPAPQLKQINDLVLRRANIDICSQRWAALYRQCVVGTHLDMQEDNLSPPMAMDAAWVELTDILGAVFAEVDKLVRAVVAFLSTPAAPLVSKHELLGFPNHNQIHVLGNLLQLPAMQHERYCHALSSLLANDEYWRVIAPLCDAQAAAAAPTTNGGPLQAAAFRYLASMVNLNVRRLGRLDLLKPLICSWITDGTVPALTDDDELLTDLRYFGGHWGSLIIHDIIAGIHGFVTRSIRGYDTRALKQRIVGVVGSVLGGVLHRPHLAQIVRGTNHAHDGDLDQTTTEAVTGLETLLLALRVIDQFGVLKAKCLPHDSLEFVRRNFAPGSEQLLDENFHAALSDAATVLERLMGVGVFVGVEEDNGGGADRLVIDRLVTDVLQTIAIDERPRSAAADAAVEAEMQHQRRRQLVDVVRSAVEKMCIGTAAGTAITQSVLPPLPPHTARRVTRKYVRTRRKLEQEVDGPVRAMLVAFFADAQQLVTDLRLRLHHHPQAHDLVAALDDVDAALDRARARAHQRQQPQGQGQGHEGRGQ